MSTRLSPLLEVSDLTVEVRRHHRTFRAVDGVSLGLPAGGSLGIVGESGSGKSMTLRAIMGLLPRAASVQAGTVQVAAIWSHREGSVAPRTGGGTSWPWSSRTR